MAYIGKDAVWFYGCTRCQKHHYQGDRLYADHVQHQDKHGIQSCPPSHAIYGKVPGLDFGDDGRLHLDTSTAPDGV